MQLHRDPGYEVGNGLPLLLPCVACEGGAKFLQLLDGDLVPASSGLGHDGDEGNSLLVAEVSCHPHLVLVGLRHGVTGLCGGSGPEGSLEGVGHGDIKGGVPPKSSPSSQGSLLISKMEFFIRANI